MARCRVFNVPACELYRLVVPMGERVKYRISSFRRVQNVVCFLLGDSPASDLYMPTFRNTLSVPSSKAGVK